MKRFFSLFLTAALAGAGFVSCSDDPEDQPVVPTDVEKVSGIETNYVLGLHEYLEITPDIELSNENESISYEWSIDYETVSTERNLSFKCDELLNDVNCYFKASSSTGAKIAEFKLSVTSPYDKGLLLLSQTGDGAMLTFKRLDIMATPASPYAFKDNNPTLSLGKEALALCWKGEGLTNLGNSIKDQDTEIILSSGNPTKVYVLNTNDMKVKTEITYNGEGEFHPNYVIYPYGVQNSLWEGELYWLGGGREYIMAADRNFITSTMEEMPEGAQFADMACSLVDTDMTRVYYNTASQKMVYISGVLGMVTEGTKACNVEPMNLIPCDGIYRDEEGGDHRYEPMNVILVGKQGSSTKIYRFTPENLTTTEEVLTEQDATGNILPTSATTANPAKPILYYSKGGDIYRFNYDGNNFDTEPYISLGDNFEVKQLVFNPYDVDTLYIAAEDTAETGEMKASLFIYDISDNSSAEKLFEDHKVGGTVRKTDLQGKRQGKRRAGGEKQLDSEQIHPIDHAGSGHRMSQSDPPVRRATDLRKPELRGSARADPRAFG